MSNVMLLSCQVRLKNLLINFYNIRMNISCHVIQVGRLLPPNYCETYGRWVLWENTIGERLNGFPRLSLNARNVFFLAPFCSRTVLTW